MSSSLLTKSRGSFGRIRFLAAVYWVFCAACLNAQSPDLLITTVAGTGINGYSTGGGIAAAAQIELAYSVAADAIGNIYIADSWNHRIRKITPEGSIQDFAGNGTKGYSGDNGPAISATMNLPRGLAVDASGNVYVSDSGNNVIRKIQTNGVIQTIVGNGQMGDQGDGGPASQASLRTPRGLAVDASGNLYIADSFNARIRKVATNGIISTFAGTGQFPSSGDGSSAAGADIGFVYALALDAKGNLFFSDTYNHCIRRVSSGGVINTIAGTGRAGFSGDGGLATAAALYLPRGLSLDATGNLFFADSGNNRIRKISPDGAISTVVGDGTATPAQLNNPASVTIGAAGNLFIADSLNYRIRKAFGVSDLSVHFTLGAGGSKSFGTTGFSETSRAGYAIAVINSGATPYGTAVFSFKQDGVTISEAGVPASPPTKSARIFIDYRSNVPALPGYSEAGTVNVNTGIAIVNHNSSTAYVTYRLRDPNGVTLSLGQSTISAGNHFACFIDQLTEKVPGFHLPRDFQFGSLEITSDQPLSVLALRGTNNQRNDFLMTTTPVADLTQSLGSGSICFPQFADGGGYTTSLILMNTSESIETGVLQIVDSTGAPFIVNQVGGVSGSLFNYSIPPGGIFHFQTDGSPAETRAGWVKLMPDPGTATPTGSGVFGYNPGNILVSESGIPSAVATTHARVYVDLSGRHNTGLAIVNLVDSNASLIVNAYQKDGVTAAGTSHGPLSLPANGHTAAFADQFISGLPEGFTGMLDISSPTPFAALTLRLLVNEREDFLMTTFPIADQTRPAPSPIVFPHIVDGGGYTTQFILIGAGETTSASLSTYDEMGVLSYFIK